MYTVARLLWRPSTMFFIVIGLFFLFISIIAGRRHAGMATTLCLCIGSAVGMAVGEFRHCQFAQVLPGARAHIARVCIALTVICGLIPIAFTRAMGVEHDLAGAFGLGTLAFAAGFAFQTSPGLSEVPTRIGFYGVSALTMFLVFPGATLLYLAHHDSFLWASTAFTLTGFYLWVSHRAIAWRVKPFAPTQTFADMFDWDKRERGQRLHLSSGTASNRTFELSKRDLWDWVSASLHEGATSMIAVFPVRVVCASVAGIAFPLLLRSGIRIRKEGLSGALDKFIALCGSSITLEPTDMLFMQIIVYVLIFGMIISLAKTRLLYPLSRRDRGRVVFASATLQHGAYFGCGAAVAIILHVSTLTLTGSELSFDRIPTLLFPLAVGFALSPWLTWMLARRLHCKIPLGWRECLILLFSVLLVFLAGIAAGYWAAFSPAFPFLPQIVLFIAVCGVTHRALHVGLRRFYARADLA